MKTSTKTSVSLPNDLHAKARALGIPISRVAQDAIRQAVAYREAVATIAAQRSTTLLKPAPSEPLGMRVPWHCAEPGCCWRVATLRPHGDDWNQIVELIVPHYVERHPGIDYELVHPPIVRCRRMFLLHRQSNDCLHPEVEKG